MNLFNLKRAANLHLFAAAILAAPVLTSCDEDDDIHQREVIITNENDKVITGDTIPVKIGSTNRTYIKIWYQHWMIDDTVYCSDTVRFWRQYDNNEPEDLNLSMKIAIENHDPMPDLDFSQGWSSEAKGIGWEDYEIRTAFSKKFVHVGSLVKIWACVGEYAKGEVWYKVEE